MMLFIKLLLAHLIGDFVLQPKSWMVAQEKYTFKTPQLYLHALLHGILIMILIWDVEFIKWAMLIVFSHLLIDALVLKVQKEKTKRVYFFVDQLGHVLVIYGICWYHGCTEINLSIFTESNLLLFTLLLFITTPSSFFIRMFVSKWSSHTEDNNKESLEDAGKYIGILERLFVFVFVVTANWEAIGFLLAAKSVFRFGDLKESKDRKLTEYILIGTLLSFGLAIASGIIYVSLR